MKSLYYLFLAIIAISLCGCWYYSFTEKPYPDISNTFVEQFSNESDRFDIAPLITEGLMDKLQGSGLLEVVGRKNAQSLISGAVVAYTNEAYSYTPGEEPVEFIVRITAKASFSKVGSDAPTWEGSFIGFATYPADESTKDEVAAREEAVSMLVDRILDRLRQG